jgi:signal transduction histidine kinase
MKHLLKNILSKRIFNRLVTQFIFSHAVLASFSVALVGFFLLTATNTFIKKSVADNQLEIARRSAQEIYYFVQNTFNTLHIAAKIPDVYLLQPFNQNRILTMLKLDNEYFRKLIIIDTLLTITASTDIGEAGFLYKSSPPLPEHLLKNQYISPVYIINDRPVITVSVSITQYGKYVGQLAAEVDVSLIWELVDKLSQRLPDGIMYIVSDQGKLIAHTNRRLVYSNEDLTIFPFITYLLQNNEGTDTYRDPYIEGKKMVCAYTPVPELNWGIVVAQTESRAFSVSREILYKLIIIIIGSIIFALLLGILITRNLVQPLKRLVEGVQRVSSGAPSSRIDIPTTEELAVLAKEFNTMTENLENVQKKLRKAERLATMSKFASVVAHEIRNPFNSIVINMRVLKQGMQKGEDPKQLEKFINAIDAEIRRIDGLIQHYLSFIKPAELYAAPVDLNILIDELILAQNARAANQSVSITHTTNEESIIIQADSNQLKQAFLNIMLNALQAMPNGGALTISVQAYHTVPEYESMVRIDFTDTGIGIEPEYLPEIFEIFFTSKTTGTGIGLAVTQQIIQMHNGKIEVTSAPRKGTTVTIYLPKER